MAKINLDAYLYFKGQAREAMEFYQSVFGGELSKQTYAEVPGMDYDESQKDWLMHVLLSGEDVRLMASDTTKASPAAAKIDLALSGDDEPRLREIFEKLSQGGEVVSELHKESWGDVFGSLTDMYGVNWMVSISTAE